MTESGTDSRTKPKLTQDKEPTSIFLKVVSEHKGITLIKSTGQSFSCQSKTLISRQLRA